MMTQAQLKAQIYNAVTSDSALNVYISGRLQWLLRPTAEQTYPLLVYQVLDTVGSYVHGGTVIQSHEQVDVQIDIYTNDITQMDGIFEELKRVMHSIGYMLTNAPEFIDGSNIVRTTRWEAFNV